jgi:hypothetical protein
MCLKEVVAVVSRALKTSDSSITPSHRAELRRAEGQSQFPAPAVVAPAGFKRPQG